MMDEALQEHRRLKSRRLCCAVVNQAQMDLEQRARQLTSWLSEVAAARILQLSSLSRSCLDASFWKSFGLTGETHWCGHIEDYL